MKNNIIILGIAPCVDEDLHKMFLSFGKDVFDFMAIGIDCASIANFDIQHAASYHPHEFPEFKERRKKLGLNTDYKTHSHMSVKEYCPDYILPLVDKSPHSGSSAFLGCQAAISIGYEKIVLCGCPLQGSNSKNQPYEVFQKGWIKHQDLLEGKVRSMSGWTKEFLGSPTIEWLNN